MEITVRCSVHPTEDVEKVRKAIETHFGAVPLNTVEHGQFIELTFSNTDRSILSVVRQSIHDKRILAVVRTKLLKNYSDLEFTTSIYLDKQAAFVGKLRLIDNAVENPPLGSIEIHFAFETAPMFKEFLDWFSPKTKDGKVIT
jgi:predicted RNA binding protein with dsRBD fold (UPF0201 family)